MENSTEKEDAMLELENAKIEVLKAQSIWNLYEANFGAEYAEKTTSYTKKMFDDDLIAIKNLEAELNE